MAGKKPARGCCVSVLSEGVGIKPALQEAKHEKQLFTKEEKWQ
jgi:hypothetical protein